MANTELKEVKHWLDFTKDTLLATKGKLFNKQHVYFQSDQKNEYIRLIVDDILHTDEAQVKHGE